MLEALHQRGFEADLGAVGAHDERAEDEVAVQVAGAGETGLGHARLEARIFLHLAHVVQHDAGDGERGVDLRIERQEGLGALGHAQGMLQQAVTIGMVHAERGDRLVEALAMLFQGGFDGWLRAYDSSSGRIVWQYDTVRDFDTVNGVPGFGGSLESAGPLVVDGHVLVNSGYLFGGRMPGNVLLVFSVGGK